MKIVSTIIFMALIVLVSTVVHADDLANNAFAKIQYQEVAILDVQSVTSKIKFVPASPTNVAYYEGYILVSAIAEGNLCGSHPASFGTAQSFEGQVLYTKLIAGEAWATQMTGCPQYSRPTRVTFPVSVNGIIKIGNTANQAIAAFKIGAVGTQSIVRIQLNAQGPQIQVSIKK